MEITTELDITTSFLRLKIDKEWNIERLVQTLDSLNIMYNTTIIHSIPNDSFYERTSFQNKKDFAKKILKKYEVIHGKTYRIQTGMFKQYFKSIETKYVISQNLTINSINYNSPGNIDLLGLGKIIEILSDLLKYYIPNKKDKIINEQERQKLIDMRIKSLKELGISEKEIIKIISLETNSNKLLGRVINEGLITGVKIIEK